MKVEGRTNSLRLSFDLHECTVARARHPPPQPPTNLYKIKIKKQFILESTACVNCTCWGKSSEVSLCGLLWKRRQVRENTQNAAVERNVDFSAKSSPFITNFLSKTFEKDRLCCYSLVSW